MPGCETPVSRGSPSSDRAFGGKHTCLKSSQEIRPLKSLEGLHLWHAPMSSCSQRVRIALAETGRAYESHVINLEKDEHATPEYQAIHPKGLVPALVDNGHLFIESIDIIRHIAADTAELASAASTELLEMATRRSST